jgi:hypothetical protein
VRSGENPESIVISNLSQHSFFIKNRGSRWLSCLSFVAIHQNLLRGAPSRLQCLGKTYTTNLAITEKFTELAW